MTTNSETPGKYNVALDGRGFIASIAQEDGGFFSSSVPVTRAQADQSARPGEQSLSAEDLWRRTVDSWHHGAGQNHADRSDSDPYRFRTSLHIDPWTKYRFSKLNSVTRSATGDANQRGDLCVAGDYLFWQRPGSLRYFSSPGGSATAVTGPAAPIYSACSDGFNVYTVHGVDDVMQTPSDTLVGANFATNAVKDLRLARFCKDRLLVFDNAGAVYDASVAGALPAALFTHRLGADWTWTDATGGESFIYMCGYTGDGSESHGVIYRTAVEEDGTSLDQPVVAARLPDGEQALAVCGYLGLVLVGTSKGVRVAIEREDGSLSMGALIESGPCRCFEPQGNQVWFGWEAFDDYQSVDGLTHSGLGRIDLSEYDGNGAPAYATDIMFPESLTVWSAATFQGERVFTASGGYYIEGAEEEVGYLTSGLFNYGLSELKTFQYLTFGPTTLAVPAVDATDANVAESNGATISLSPVNLTISDPTFPGSTGANGNASTFDLQGRRAMAMEYRVDLYDSYIEQVTLLARPAVPYRSEVVQVTLLVPESDDLDGLDSPRNPAEDVAHIRRLVQKGAPVDFQDGAETYKVVVEDYRYVRTSGGETVGKWNGAIRVQLKRFDTVSPLFRNSSSNTETSSATNTVTAPSGTLPGDVHIAAVAWDDESVAAPSASGWTLTGSSASGTYKGVATFVPTDPNTAPAPTFTFASPVSSAAVIAAYTTGTSIDVEGTLSGSMAGDSTLTVTEIVEEPLAIVVASATSAPTGSKRFVPPVRTRVSATVTSGGRDLTVCLGDAQSVSTFPSEALAPGAAFIDILSRVVPYEDDVTLIVNRLA